uniref:BTB domain-containing protein n=1 Tax=Panagrolaimus sp. ES5 TaxID=591445 RepID=A0AC34F047_9BILA
MKTSSLLQQLQQSFDSGEDYDMTFIVGGEEIHAHGFILKLRSPFMKEKLMRMPLKTSLRLQIKNVKPHDFKSFLSFLYTDDCEVTVTNVEVLLNFGHEWSVPSLIEKCFTFIENQIDETNIMHYAELGLKYLNSNGLLSKCFSILPDILLDVNFVYQKNGEWIPISYTLVMKIVKECERSDMLEDAFFRKVFDWAKRHCDRQGINPTPKNLKYFLNEILPFINFEHLRPVTMATIVRENDLLPADDFIDYLCKSIVKS